MINIEFKKSEKIKRNGKDITIDSYELSPFKILMMGGTGTGKTSLLACMHEEFASGTSGVNFAFEPDDDETFNALDHQLERLKFLIHEMKPGKQYVDSRNEIVGSSGSKKYIFRGIKTGEGAFHDKKFHFPIQFQDIPGGWYTDAESTEVKEKTTKLMETADAYVYCIDTPAMMSGEPFHHVNNKYLTVKRWLDRAADDHLLAGKSIIFVLSRSERWRSEEDKVINQFKENYAALIERVKSDGVSIYVTPVYTLGGVVFTAYNENKVPIYTKVGPRKAGKCSIPLIQLLHDGMAWYERVLHELNENPWIRMKNALGITHYDLAEECSKEMRQVLSKLCDESIIIHKPQTNLADIDIYETIQDILKNAQQKC